MEDVKTSMTSNKKRRFKEDSVTYDEQQSGSSSMSKINKKAAKSWQCLQFFVEKI